MEEVRGKLNIHESYPDDGVEGTIWVGDDELKEILEKYKNKRIKITIEEIRYMVQQKGEARHLKGYADIGYVQVELLQDVRYGSYDYAKGELLWIEPADASACAKMGAVRIL